VLVSGEYPMLITMYWRRYQGHGLVLGHVQPRLGTPAKIKHRS